MITRRRFMAGFTLACCMRPALGASAGTILVTKDPNCGCCEGWVEHLRSSGFSLQVNETLQFEAVKTRLGIPKDLWSCHTAEIGSYAVEGHVPAAAVQRLLRERPQAAGLAVPGMPVGAPGMEVEGVPSEEYTVFLFGSFGRRPYARYKATTELTR